MPDGPVQVRAVLVDPDQVELVAESEDATEVMFFLPRSAAIALGLDLIAAATTGVSEMAHLLDAAWKVPVKPKPRTAKDQAAIEAFTEAVVVAREAGATGR